LHPETLKGLLFVALQGGRIVQRAQNMTRYTDDLHDHIDRQRVTLPLIGGFDRRFPVRGCRAWGAGFASAIDHALPLRRRGLDLCSIARV
jgi:hypothetical protein